MSARDTIRSIQTLLGTRQDGIAVPGGATDNAWRQLMATPGDGAWPPVSSAGFNGEYSAALRDEYTRLFGGMEMREPQQKGDTDWPGRATAQAMAIRKNQPRYGKVADLLVHFGAGASDNIWVFIGIVHCLEGDLDFSTHLANGDPLTARTVQEPKGLPADGQPPFTWEQAALASLIYKKLHQLGDWSIPMLLFQFERYNGFGYRRFHPDTLTPYLWSGSKYYRNGKYVADGTWGAEAVSQQVGAAVLLRALGYTV